MQHSLTGVVSVFTAVIKWTIRSNFKESTIKGFLKKNYERGGGKPCFGKFGEGGGEFLWTYLTHTTNSIFI